MSNPLNGKTYPVLLAVLAIVVTVVIKFLWFVTPITIDHGYVTDFSATCSENPASILPEIAPGQKFRICLFGVNYHEVDETIGNMWLYDCHGDRIDLPKDSGWVNRPIPLPAQAGLLEGTGKKSRAETMVDAGLPACDKPSAIGGSLTSTDWFVGLVPHKVTYLYPRMQFMAKAKSP